MSRDLIGRVARGDETAFRQVVEQYEKSVLNLSYRFTGSIDAAEEITQETFVKAYMSAAQYVPQGTLGAWLRQIATNLCLNRKRTIRRHPTISLEEFKEKVASVASGRRPDAELERKEREQVVREALCGLPERQRMAVILQRYEGLPYDQIAKVMNCSVSAVESLLFRAKCALMEKLRPYFDTD